MNDDSVKNLKLTGDPSAGKIVFKHYTPIPGSEDLAVTIGGVEHAYEWDNPDIGVSDTVLEMKDQNGDPLACWSAIILFHEFAHAAILYDKDWNVDFTQHGPYFKNKLDNLKKEDINPLYLQSAKAARSPVKMCINPSKCIICDRYKSDLAGTTVGRKLKMRGARRNKGWR